MAILEELAESIIKGQAPTAEQLTEKALNDGMSPEDVLPILLHQKQKAHMMWH